VDKLAFFLWRNFYDKASASYNDLCRPFYPDGAHRIETKETAQLPLDLKPAATFTPLSSVINVPFELKKPGIQKKSSTSSSRFDLRVRHIVAGGMKPVN